MSVEISNQQVFPKFDGEAVLSIKFVDGSPQLEFNTGDGWEPFGEGLYTSSTAVSISGHPELDYRMNNIGNSVIRLLGSKNGIPL